MGASMVVIMAGRCVDMSYGVELAVLIHWIMAETYTITCTKYKYTAQKQIHVTHVFEWQFIYWCAMGLGGVLCFTVSLY